MRVHVAQTQEDNRSAQLTAASFGGAPTSQPSALLTGDSVRDFVDRAQDLELIAAAADAA